MQSSATSEKKDCDNIFTENTIASQEHQNIWPNLFPLTDGKIFTSIIAGSQYLSSIR